MLTEFRQIELTWSQRAEPSTCWPTLTIKVWRTVVTKETGSSKAVVIKNLVLFGMKEVRGNI